jgi:hypothetical protein
VLETVVRFDMWQMEHCSQKSNIIIGMIDNRTEPK